MDFGTLKKNLENHGYAVRCFATKEEASSHLAEVIKGETVGFGGSVTLQEMKLDDRLKDANTVIWHWHDPKARDRYPEFTAYVTSVNAIAETGEMVNIDGTGNRVAATIYGPKKIYFVVGRNKVAADLASAIDRARNIASPPNCKRLELPNPCVKSGRCHDCNSPRRICNVMAIHMRPMLSADYTEVILIDEDLGY